LVVTNEDEQVDQQAIELDCRTLDPQQLSERLQALPAASQIVLDHPASAGPGLAAGLNVEADFQVNGDLEDFALMLTANSNWDIRGNAGVALGHSMVSAKILVRGSVGDHLAAFAQGGFIAVHGKAGDGVAYSLSGGEVLVRSASGNYAGAFMSKGTLVLANGTGHQLGFGLTGGTVFVRGEVASIAPSLRKLRMKDTDAMRLSLLLARAKIRGEAKDFKLYQVKAAASKSPGEKK
jgi:formylmethanofuran dehydrogenase subunit C